MKRAFVLITLVACGGRARSMTQAVAVSVTPVASPVSSSVPPPPPPDQLREPATQIVAAAGSLCLRLDGRVYCASVSELDQPLVQEANAVSGLSDATHLAMGQSFGCAATRRGTVSCWGDNTFGQLGAKLRAEKSETAVEVIGVTHARRVFAGPWHACALLDDASLRCWGRNDSGQTGSDTHYLPEARELVHATEVAGVRAEQLACSSGSTCARTTSHEVWCWGAPRDHVWGAQPPNHPPRQARELPKLDAIAAGESATCGLQSGNVVCWGGGRRFAVRDPEVADALVVVPGIQRALHLSVADDHACALVADGSVSCFGFGYSGALGRAVDENDFDRQAAETVSGLPRAVAVTVAGGISCALTRDDEVYCWGRWYTAKGPESRVQPARVPLR